MEESDYLFLKQPTFPFVPQTSEKHTAKSHIQLKLSSVKCAFGFYITLQKFQRKHEFKCYWRFGLCKKTLIQSEESLHHFDLAHTVMECYNINSNTDALV